jgi:hypothetical protein
VAEMKSTQPKEKAKCKCDYTKYMQSLLLHSAVMEARDSIRDVWEDAEELRVNLEEFMNTYH